MSKIETIPIELHPLDPFLPKNGRILLLGSFPPQRKRWCIDFFYPNYSNDMWRVMGNVFFGDALHFVDIESKKFNKEEITKYLLEKGIGIFDAAFAVRRLSNNASDKDLEVVKLTNIEELLQKMPQCHIIAATGQKSAETVCEQYKIKMPALGSYTEFELNNITNRLYRMPSTSRAYPLALAKKAEIYKHMFEEVI